MNKENILLCSQQNLCSNLWKSSSGFQKQIQQAFVISFATFLSQRTEETQNYSRIFSVQGISLDLSSLIISANSFCLLRGSVGSSRSREWAESRGTCKDHGSGCFLGWRWHCKPWLGKVPFISILFTFHCDFISYTGQLHTSKACLLYLRGSCRIICHMLLLLTSL